MPASAPNQRKPVQTAGLGNCYYDSLAVALLAQLPKDVTDRNRILALQQFTAIHTFLKTASALNLKPLAETASTTDSFLVEILKAPEWRTNLTTALRLYLADLMSKKLNSSDSQSDSTPAEFYAQLKSDFEQFKKNKAAYQYQANASHYSFSQVPAIQTFFETNSGQAPEALVAAFKTAQNKGQMLQAYITCISQDRAWADPIVQGLVAELLPDAYVVNPEVSSTACVQLKHDKTARHFSPLLSTEELNALNKIISSAKLSFAAADNAAVVAAASSKSVADFMKTSDWSQTYQPKDPSKTAAKEAPKKTELNNKTIVITYAEKDAQQAAETVSLTLDEDAKTKRISLKAEHSKDEKTPLEKQYQRIADNLFLTAAQLTKAEDGRYRFDIDSVNHTDQLQMIAASLYAAGFAEVFHKGVKLENKAAVANAEVQTEEALNSAPEPTKKTEPASGITLTASPQELDLTAEVNQVLTGLVDEVVEKAEAERAADGVIEAVMQGVCRHIEQADQAAEEQALEEAQQVLVQSFLQKRLEGLRNTISKMMEICGISSLSVLGHKNITLTKQQLSEFEKLLKKAQGQVEGLYYSVAEDKPRNLAPEFKEQVDCEKQNVEQLNDYFAELKQVRRQSELAVFSTVIYKTFALSAAAAMSSYAIHAGLQFLKTQTPEVDPLPCDLFACDPYTQRCEFLDRGPERPLVPYVNAVDSMVCQPVVNMASRALVPFYKRTAAPAAANLVTELVPSAALLAYFVGANLREALVAIPRGLVFTPVAIAAAESLPYEAEAQLPLAISKVPAVNYSTLQSAMNLLWPAAYLLGAVNPATAVAGLAIQCATTLFSTNTSCESVSNTTEFVTRK